MRMKQPMPTPATVLKRPICAAMCVRRTGSLNASSTRCGVISSAYCTCAQPLSSKTTRTAIASFFTQAA